MRQQQVVRRSARRSQQSLDLRTPSGRSLPF